MRGVHGLQAQSLRTTLEVCITDKVLHRLQSTREGQGTAKSVQMIYATAGRKQWYFGKSVQKSMEYIPCIRHGGIKPTSRSFFSSTPWSKRASNILKHFCICQDYCLLGMLLGLECCQLLTAPAAKCKYRVLSVRRHNGMLVSARYVLIWLNEIDAKVSACNIPQDTASLGQLSREAVLEDDARHAACCAATCFAPLELVLQSSPLCRPCTPAGTPFNAEKGIFCLHPFIKLTSDICRFSTEDFLGQRTTECRCHRLDVLTQPSLLYSN